LRLRPAGKALAGEGYIPEPVLPRHRSGSWGDRQPARQPVL